MRTRAHFQNPAPAGSARARGQSVLARDLACSNPVERSGLLKTRRRQMPRTWRDRSTVQSAFTLVEVLAALLMMAIIIPVAMEGMSVASRAGVLGQRKAAAMRVAERMLNELIVEGQTEQASTSGNVADGDTNYPWAMKSETWSEDAMLHLTVTVTFTVQGNNYDVSASTLIAPPSTTTGVAGTTR